MEISDRHNDGKGLKAYTKPEMTVVNVEPDTSLFSASPMSILMDMFALPGDPGATRGRMELYEFDDFEDEEDDEF